MRYFRILVNVMNAGFIALADLTFLVPYFESLLEKSVLDGREKVLKLEFDGREVTTTLESYHFIENRVNPFDLVKGKDGEPVSLPSPNPLLTGNG
jgi:hypothetical protein